MSAILSGTFGATGESTDVPLFRNFNISIQGTFTATVHLQRTFDDGATWETTATYTAPVSTAGEEIEKGVSYRLSCSAYTSGTATYRLGQSGFS